MSREILAFDIGGTHVRAAVIEDGRLIRDVKRRWSESPRGPEDDVRVLEEMKVELAGADELPVGVALGALVDRDGVVLEWPNRPLWVGAGARALIERALGAAVSIDDDANCAAVAEWKLGAARGASHALVMTIGTGIGSGLIAGGALLRGSRGWAGELGHVTMDPEGPACSCGRRGCLQALASGRALEREAKRNERDGVAALFAAAEAGESWAVEALAASARWLGIAAANAVNLLDLEVIVVGGGLGAIFPERWWQDARNALFANILGRKHRTVRLERAAFGDTAGLLGAALLAPNPNDD